MQGKLTLGVGTGNVQMKEDMNYILRKILNHAVWEKNGGTHWQVVAHWALSYRNILNKRDLTLMKKSWKALQILKKTLNSFK